MVIMDDGGIKMVGRVWSMTKRRYEDLASKVAKVTGFNVKVQSYESRMEKMMIEIRTLRSEVRTHRRIIQNLRDKTRKL